MTWPRGRALDGGIDEIPLPCARGRLWLCGKHAVGPDPESALRRVGATTIVCLSERSELADRYPAYVEWLGSNAPGRAVWSPVPDMHAPAPSVMRALVADLQHRLAQGEALLVHCGAGIGRTGTVAVALLLANGTALDDAIELVAACRPMAGPEVGAQLALLETLSGG